MTTIEAIQSELAPELKQLNELIATRLHSSNELLNRVVHSYLRTKGKQIRPILVILTAKMFNSFNDVSMAAAASVEMLHNASLIHDDIVDDAKLRRGQPTINSLWDNHIAVLVGDFFTATSLTIASDTGNSRLIRCLANLGRLLSLGELDQLYNAQSHRLDEKSYFQVISRKTASLFVTCIEMGAHSAGATDDEIKIMGRFGELLGLCFQIRDDIFDYFDSEDVGKPTGNDLREGKITLPLLYALTKGKHPEREKMLKIIEQDEFTPEQISALIEFAKESGGIEYAYSTMERLYNEAMQLLSGFDRCESIESFDTLFRYIIARDY